MRDPPLGHLDSQIILKNLVKKGSRFIQFFFKSSFSTNGQTMHNGKHFFLETNKFVHFTNEKYNF